MEEQKRLEKKTMRDLGMEEDELEIIKNYVGCTIKNIDRLENKMIEEMEEHELIFTEKELIALATVVHHHIASGKVILSINASNDDVRSANDKLQDYLKEFYLKKGK